MALQFGAVRLLLLTPLASSDPRPSLERSFFIPSTTAGAARLNLAFDNVGLGLLDVAFALLAPTGVVVQRACAASMHQLPGLVSASRRQNGKHFKASRLEPFLWRKPAHTDAPKCSRASTFSTSARGRARLMRMSQKPWWVAPLPLMTRAALYRRFGHQA